jgi:hypothetical protein
MHWEEGEEEEEDCWTMVVVVMKRVSGTLEMTIVASNHRR